MNRLTKILSGLLFAAVALSGISGLAATIPNPSTPWFILCEDGRTVRQSPFSAGMTPEQLCGEDRTKFPSDPTEARGAPEDFVALFGKYPVTAKPGGRISLSLKASQVIWEEELGNFIGVVTPEMVAEPGGRFDAYTVFDARAAGEFVSFTPGNVALLESVSTKYLTGLPVFYLSYGQRIWPGDKSFGALLKVKFINIPVNRNLRGYGPLKFPYHVVTLTQVKLVLKGHCVQNVTATFPPSLSKRRRDACSK